MLMPLMEYFQKLSDFILPQKWDYLRILWVKKMALILIQIAQNLCFLSSSFNYHYKTLNF